MTGESYENESATEPEADAEEIQPKNFISRLAGVYISPGATFAEIGRAPRILIPIIVLLAVSLLGGLYMSKRLDLESIITNQLDGLVQQGRMTKEQMEQSMPAMLKLASVQLMVAAPLFSLLMALVIAAVGKLISVMTGAENRFKPLFLVAIYTTLAVSIISTILFVVVTLFKEPGSINVTSIGSAVRSNLGAMIEAIAGEDALPKFLMKLAGWVDVFAIWQICLLSIGFSAVSRKLKTATAATWIGTIYAIIAIIGSLISSRTS
jgi:hypothetical protein